MWAKGGMWVECVPVTTWNAPNPRPGHESGVYPGQRYEVLGCSNQSETGEAYFLICNGRNEPWFMPTRHFRFTSTGEKTE